MTDWTNYIDDASIHIENAIRHELSTLRMTARASSRLTIRDHDHIVITGDDQRRVFAGFVSTYKEIPKGPLFTYAIGAVGYGWMLDNPHAKITKKFQNQTEIQIITYIMRQGADRIGVGGVSNVLASAIDEIEFHDMTPRQCLDDLCDLTGAVYYVGYQPIAATLRLATLYYFEPGAISAPFNLSDQFDYVSTFPYEDLEVVHQGIIANRVTVKGSYTLGDEIGTSDTTKWLPSNGTDTIVWLPWKYSPPVDESEVKVYVNTGSNTFPNWAEKTVGEGNVDSLDDYEVLHYFDEQKLEFATAPPDLLFSVRVAGREWQPISYTATDEASWGTYGRWIEKTYTVPSINDLTTLQQYAENKLAALGGEQVTYTLTVERPGLRSGMSIELTHAGLGLSAESLIIQRVHSHLQKGCRPKLYLELGAYRYTGTDITRELSSLDKQVLSKAVGESRARRYLLVIGSSTDNAVVRWDGTDGDAVQDSGVTIDDDDNLVSPGKASFGTTSADGQVHIDQNDPVAGIPVLVLDQADVDEAFVKVIGEAAAGDLTRSLVDEGDQASETLIGWEMIEVEDAGGQIANGKYHSPLYTLA